MAVPTFVAEGTNNTGTGAVTGGMPAGATTDDILIYRIESWGVDAAPAVTAGWTLVGTRISDSLAVDDARVTVWWAPYSAGINRTVADTGDHTNVRITAWRGCDTTNPIHVVATDAEITNVTSHTFVGPTTTVADCKIVCVVAFGDDSNTGLASGPTNPNVTSIGQGSFNAVASGSDGAGYICWGDLATAGASGTWTMGVTTAERSAAVIFALKPPPAAGTTVTPATVAAVAAVPAPTVQAAATKTPATVAAVTTVPGPTAKAASLVAPATVPAVVTVPTPTPVIAPVVTPAVVPATADAPTPQPVVPATRTPAVVPAVGSVPTPSVTVAPTVLPATVPATADAPTPTTVIGGGTTTVTPNTVPAVTTVPTPTVLAAALVTPATVALLTTVPTPTINVAADATVLPATVPAVVAVPTPQPVVPATRTPATVALLAAVPTPTVIVPATVLPATVALLATVPAPSILAAAKVLPATVALVTTVPAPTTAVPNSRAPATVAAVATVPGPTAKGAAVVTPATVAAVATVGEPTIFTGFILITARNPVMFYRQIATNSLSLAPLGRSQRVGWIRGGQYEEASTVVIINTGDEEAVMASVAAAYALHGTGPIATLKSAIHARLQEIGYRGVDGANLP